MISLKNSFYIDRYERFLENLRRARLAAGLTQAEAAKLLGKPQSYVSKCEAGERRVDVIEAESFAIAYGAEITNFLSD